MTNQPESAPAVDAYLSELLAPADEALAAALADSEAAGLPSINVSATNGKLLHLIARIQGARSILEIGTLGGYSTIWLARALPADGSLITLEYSPVHAEVARANIARAALDEVVQVRVGAALDTLPQLAAEERTFDLVFIDADKVNNPRYLEWALRMARPGSVIVVDNVVRGGRVADAANTDPDVTGTRDALQLLADHPKLSATAIQTVGAKGHDGFALAYVQD
ncbi:O-methyltransferase [Streptomyces sp. SID14478]|uniref:O-methyltransferase n=1 Tax=Streptomyces sp. SID14478 TaxID=2706073 RepID=UPI0013D93010|nr:O-methyltransferase [Streptomyces sp. SID14478]NEB76934.1 O-methyltransferase [Streptomyces sp. SID14478]